MSVRLLLCEWTALTTPDNPMLHEVRPLYDAAYVHTGGGLTCVISLRSQLYRARISWLSQPRDIKIVWIELPTP